MIRIKSAQFRDFTDVNVRRVIGYIGEEQQSCQTKLEVIAKVQERMSEIRSENPYITLGELTSDPQLQDNLNTILGADHWTLSEL